MQDDERIKILFIHVKSSEMFTDCKINADRLLRVAVGKTEIVV